MKTENIKAADAAAEISIEISSAGVRRVLITTDPGDADGQTQAHLLLARVTPQLLLLDEALRKGR